MGETDDFLASALPRLEEMDTALHNGDVSQRLAMWSHKDPVTVFGALLNVRGWDSVRQAFEWLASRFSNGSYQYEVIAAGASGDLGYIAGVEHSSASVAGGPPESYELRVTTILRREDGEWKVVHRHADPMPDSESARGSSLALVKNELRDKAKGLAGRGFGSNGSLSGERSKNARSHRP